MKKLLRFKIIFLIACDILLIPGLIFCKWLSGQMLAQPGVCVWTLMGIQCITCGGTRLVNSLLSGHILQAFSYNPYIFIIIVLLAISYLLLHLWWIGKVPFAGKLLKKAYSIPGLLIFAASTGYFLVFRNIPTWIRMIEYIVQSLRA